MLTVYYHPPGLEVEEHRIRRLIRCVESLSMAPVKLCRLNKPCSPEGLPVLLMPLRGRHWLRLERQLGRKVYTIPPHVTAAAIASRACRAGASRVILAYKRYPCQPPELREDLHVIMEALKRLGLQAEVAELGSQPRRTLPGSGSCMVVPMVVAHGSILLKARELAKELGCMFAGSLLDYGFWLLASWLASMARSTSSTVTL